MSAVRWCGRLPASRLSISTPYLLLAADATRCISSENMLKYSRKMQILELEKWNTHVRYTHIHLHIHIRISSSYSYSYRETYSYFIFIFRFGHKFRIVSMFVYMYIYNGVHFPSQGRLDHVWGSRETLLKITVGTLSLFPFFDDTVN